MSLAPAPPSMHVVMRDRCFQRTSSGAAQHRPYVATTEQMWALHHATPEHLQPAILLGAFVGLRTAEVAGLRLAGVDLMGCIIRPAQQDNGEPLKTETSRTPLPSRRSWCCTSRPRWPAGEATTSPTAPAGRPRHGRSSGPAGGLTSGGGLPEGFPFHDLRHYLASLLNASGLDVKVVQPRLRHDSVKTTLDTQCQLNLQQSRIRLLSCPLPSGRAADRSPEGPLPGTQTHALAAAIKGTRGPPVIHLSELACTSMCRRRRTLETFSSARAAIKIPMGYTSDY
jgi:hypothetical protein